MHPLRHDFDGEFRALTAVRTTDLTAAGAGDNAEVTGATINRLNAQAGMADSLIFEIVGVATITATKALNVIGTLEHSDDGTTFAAAPAVYQPSGVAGGAIGSVSATGVNDVLLKYKVPKAAGLKQFVRLKITPDLTAGATDTARVGAIALLGGVQLLPSP
jgi:hypothetical protein